MPFHRLVVPTYLGGLPSGYDYINNAISGTPAPADASAKASGVNAGSYFVTFQEDASSFNTNRANQALSENCDFLDDAVSGQLPILAELQGTAGGSTSQLQLTGLSVYVGPTTYTGTSEEIDRLIKILNTDGDEMYDPVNGQKITVNQILDSTNTSNVVGQEASNFHTSPWLSFVPDLPAGDYRIVYGGQSTLVKVAADLTDSDGITRSILGSHIVPAAANRFFLETSRRDVGGSVEALVTDRIETPGNGDNIGTPSSALDVHLDPADTFTNRSFAVESGIAPNNMLTLAENTAAGQLRVTSAYELVFNDANITFDHPLTSVTNGPSIRTGEVVPSSSSEVQPIFDAINNRWTVTCGDGTDSFGDFNGVSAITDALDWYKTKTAVGTRDSTYGNGVHILVKPGRYEVADVSVEHALGTGEGSTAIIEGMSSSSGGSTIVTVLSSATTAGFTVGSGNTGVIDVYSRLELRNLVLRRQTGSDLKLAQVLANGTLRLKDCAVDNLTIDLKDGQEDADVLIIERCRFAQTALTVATISISEPTSATLSGQRILVRDSVFEQPNQSNRPLVEFSYGNANTRNLKAVSFQGCTLHTGVSTVTSSVPDGNSGLFALNYVAGSTVPTIGELSWKDCEVIGNANGGPTLCGMLLHIRPPNNTNVVEIGHVCIDGGSWYIADTDYAVTPVYVGGKDHGTDPHISRITVCNARLGAVDNSIGVEYGDPPDYDASAPDISGAFFFCVNDHGIVENVHIVSSANASKQGELHVDALSAGAMFYVSNVRLTVSGTNGGGTVARSRIVLEAGFGGSRVHADSISIYGDGVASSGGVSPLGAVYIKSSTLTSRYITLDRCTVENYKVDGAHGFFGETWSSGITFRDCTAVACDGSGFFFDTNQSINELRFVRCISELNTQYGIRVRTTQAITGTVDVTVDGCKINGNDIPNNNLPGLSIVSVDWANSYFRVVNNICYGNNSSDTASQMDIQCGTVGLGVLTGNILAVPGSISGSYGGIRLGTTGTATIEGVVGSETEYTGNIPGSDRRSTTVGSETIYNIAEVLV